MPLSKSIFAYDDIREVGNRALLAPKGIRITLDTPGAAKNFVQRFNYFRRDVDRAESRKIYPQDHPSWNKSIYDALAVSHSGPVVELRRRSIDDIRIEEIE